MGEDKRLNEVIRVRRKPSSFVTMDKGFLENPDLSWKAKGILAYLLSKPDNWKVIVGNVIKNATDGKGSVYKGLGELKELGYYEKVPVRDERGVIVRWDSVVLEVPNARNPKNGASRPLPKNQEMDNQEMENPFMDKPFLENRERNNNYSTKKDLNNIKISDNQSSQVLSARPKPQTVIGRVVGIGQDKDRTDGCTAREIEAYTALIKDNIGYDELADTKPYDMALVDEFVAIIIDALFTKGGTVRIGREDKPRELVKSVLQKLNYNDIEHAIDQFKGVTERITKKKQYILTMLYNCKMENDSHYTNAYHADKWQ